MIRILLVDDQPNIRRGLCMRLSLEPDIEVVGEAGDGAAAVALAQELRPDIVLMDIQMPVMDGIAATEELRSKLPDCAIVVLSLYDDAATRSRAAAAGAVDFVTKCNMDATLLQAIRGAA